MSGRGIGMDVVRSEIATLGGRIEVSTTRRARARRSCIYLPLTLAVAQAVLVRAGGRLWALPAPMVEQVQQIKAEDLLDLLRRGARSTGRGARYPFHYLPRLLGDSQHNPETQRHNSVLLLRIGPEHRGRARRRNGRQPGSRGQEHRAAARARVRHRRRDGAGQRRDRADHQPGAARRSASTSWRRSTRERDERLVAGHRAAHAAPAARRRWSWSSTTR